MTRPDGRTGKYNAAGTPNSERKASKFTF